NGSGIVMMNHTRLLMDVSHIIYTGNQAQTKLVNTINNEVVNATVTGIDSSIESKNKKINSLMYLNGDGFLLYQVSHTGGGLPTTWLPTLNGTGNGIRLKKVFFGFPTELYGEIVYEPVDYFAFYIWNYIYTGEMTGGKIIMGTCEHGATIFLGGLGIPGYLNLNWTDLDYQNPNGCNDISSVFWQGWNIQLKNTHQATFTTNGTNQINTTAYCFNEREKYHNDNSTEINYAFIDRYAYKEVSSAPFEGNMTRINTYCNITNIPKKYKLITNKSIAYNFNVPDNRVKTIIWSKEGITWDLRN
ncbi:hypothetical protein ACFL43_07620, partial [Thermodesulfobacteriota bacterium]